MSVFIPFGPADWAVVNRVGERRHAQNKGRRNTADLPEPKGLRTHKIGVGGEWGTVRHYGCPELWNEYTTIEERRHTGDVGEYEVRTTPHLDGGLLLKRKEHHPERVYICARLQLAGCELAGWIPVGSDGMVPRWWRTNLRSPCWIVPARVLEDIETLPPPRAGV